MEQLEDLPSVSRISDNVVRVLGQNPGKFTLQGTNTYILGNQNPYTLVDTGEGRQEYIPILESALKETAKSSNLNAPDISDIIVSHWHHDHVGGLPEVLTMLRKLWDERRGSSSPFIPPRLHKYPVLPNALPEDLLAHNTLPNIIESLPKGLYTPAPDGSPFHDLHDLQVLESSVTLRVLHTPGHTVDSICLHIQQDRALYSADTVLGQGTAVFEDLATYLSSLNKMLSYGTSDDSPDSYKTVYPAHGPVIQNGKETIATYIKHRLDREAQILQVIKSSAPKSDSATLDSSTWTTWDIVKTLYAKYPESLWLPAARGVDLHLRKLEGEGKVKKAGGEGKDTSWKLLTPRSSPAL